MIRHPFQQNRFTDRINIRFCHGRISNGICKGNSRQISKVLRSNTVEVVYPENLEENCEPGFSLKVGVHTFNRFGLEVIVFGEKLQELEVV